jgi:hypothetical protein
MIAWDELASYLVLSSLSEPQMETDGSRSLPWPHQCLLKLEVRIIRSARVEDRETFGRLGRDVSDDRWQVGAEPTDAPPSFLITWLRSASRSGPKLGLLTADAARRSLKSDLRLIVW